jgi:tetraacyldisaccharide 4'-kinase
MAALRLVLLPISWLFGLVLRIRHGLYDAGIFRTSEAAVPTIVVGNIALGGTGKTPHVELVLRTLLATTGPRETPPRVATLSRGYGRAGKDFHEVGPEDDSRLVGDEPLMLKRKYSGARVFVGADRAAAVKEIVARLPDVQAIVLDDALQHRAFKAGLYIALTTWQKPWHRDYLLPAGHLRDIPHRAREAQLVIVTKCPGLPTPKEQHHWRQRLRLRDAQALYFSNLEYGPLRWASGQLGEVPSGPQTEALVFSGIADPTLFEAQAARLFGKTYTMRFADHHRFKKEELQRMADVFHSFAHDRKILITTEKDAARLGRSLHVGPLAGLPVAVIDVRATILNEPYRFEAQIRAHVATHPTHR